MDRAIAEKPLDVRFGVARMIERNGAIVEARQRYEEILSTNPEHTESLHRLGVVSLRLEDIDDAVQLLEKAAANEPPSAELLGDLGYAYFVSGNLESAEQTLREAIEIDPEDGRLVNNLALVVGAQGRTEESLQWFRRVHSEAEAQANLGFVLSLRGEHDAAKEHYHLALRHQPDLEKAALGLAEYAKLEKNRGEGKNSPR